MDNQTLKKIDNEVIDFIRRIVISDKREGNLERSAFIILRQLSTYGPAGVKTLAEQLDLDSSTISRQASALTDKHYVDKTPNPDDKRSFFYSITPDGTSILNENKKRRMDELNRALGDWTKEECEIFASLLNKYNQSVNKEKKL